MSENFHNKIEAKDREFQTKYQQLENKKGAAQTSEQMIRSY